MTFLLYFLKVVVCSGILFGYYYLFLRNKRFHHYNRFYLLATLVLSIVLPFIKIPVFGEDPGMLNQVVFKTASIVTLPSATQPANLPDGDLGASPLLTLSNLVWVLYGAGILFLLTTLGRSLWYIRSLSHRYPFELVEKLKFYQTQEPGTPFSFFRSIFWNEQLNFNSAEGQQIFRHELFHVQQKHTGDILLAELITSLGWFNPFFYLVKKELKAIHEFLADQYAASGNNRYQYAELLVQQVMTHRQQLLAHHFFQNQLKRRIAMITQLNQSKYGYWSRVMVLPVSLLLFFSMSLYAGQQKEDAVSDNKRTTNGGQTTDIFHTDTIPPSAQQAARAAQLEEIRQKQLIQEKMLQEKAIKRDSKHQQEIEQKLQEAAFEYEVTQKKRIEELQFHYNEERVKEAELKKNQIKQLLLEDIIKKKATQTDRKIDAVLKKELQDLKMQEKVLQQKTTLAREKELANAYAYEQQNRSAAEAAHLLEMRKAAAAHVAEEHKMTYEKEQLVHQQQIEVIKKAQKVKELQGDTLQSSIIRFFNKSFRYPMEMIDSRGEGVIWYSFFLDETGKMRDYETYTAVPAVAQGKIQEIVIIAYPRKQQSASIPLTEERIQQLLKEEILRIEKRSGGLFGMKNIKPTRYYFKANFMIEKEK